MEQNSVINLSICLSDIPKDKFKKSEKNGKIYVSLDVRARKEKDQYDNDISVAVSKTKDERAAGAETIYAGNGRHIFFTGTNEKVEDMAQATDDDLPF